jgi:predicted regulator of Ras-like GTPase activity (Roadblock/LC7/MglB family)
MAPVTTPRYRYREEAPEVISVPAAELVARLPEELRGESGAEVTDGLYIDLPCSEILHGSVPRISLGRLGELASGLVRIPEGRDQAEKIALPPGWIALHFRMVTRREELPTETEKESSPVVIEPLAVDPVAEAPKTVIPEKEVTVLDVEPVAASVPEPVRGNEGPSITPEEIKEEPVAAPKKGFFSSLPMFRRTEPAEKSPALAPAPILEPTKPVEEKPAQEGSVPPVGKELVPSAPVLERLWKLDPQNELADGSALQALFMTDEKLTLEKVVSKAGELPGLDACVLAHGDRVICASKAPAGTDLQTLSGQAMTMLSQIRDSSEKMGLGSVPAVTLHADRGVVSFLHRGELCLLVLHADRGFVPGVRERLQEMLGHLSEARPALPPTS